MTENMQSTWSRWGRGFLDFWRDSKLTAHERKVLFVFTPVLLGLATSFVLIAAFFSDEFIFSTSLTTGILDVQIIKVAIQAERDESEHPTNFVTPDTDGWTTALINTGDVLTFRFSVLNRGYSAARIRPTLAFSWDATLPESGNLLLFPTTLSDAAIITAIRKNDFSQALIDPTHSDTTPIITSSGSRTGLHLTLNELVLDSEYPQGQQGQATTPGEFEHDYQFKLVFWDTPEVSASAELYGQTPLEINLAVAATTTPVASSWHDEAATFFRLRGQRFTGLEYYLDYDPLTPTRGNVTVTLVTNYPIATPAGWLVNGTDKTVFTKTYTDNNDDNPDIFTISDLEGRDEQEVTVTISNIDREPPTLILNEPNPYYLDGSYDEPGYKVSDNKDPQVSVSISGVEAIDYLVVGEYAVTYTATDAAGNTTSLIRRVIVEETFAAKVMAVLGCSEVGLANCRYPAATSANYVWYSGLLWRILGVNSDYSVRLIAQENLTLAPYSTDDYDFLESLADEWLNNYFAPKLFTPSRFLVAADACNSGRILSGANNLSNLTCTNSNTITPLVGLISSEDYNRVRGTASTNYLLMGNYFATMTGFGSNLYLAPPSAVSNGNLVSTSATNFVGLRPVINVVGSTRLRGGDGTFDPAAVSWSQTSGPFQFAYYNQAITHETRLNERQPGEFVRINNYLYRLSEVLKDGGVRLILDDFITETGSHKAATFNTTTGASAALYDPTNPDSVAYFLQESAFLELFPTPESDPLIQDQIFVRQNHSYHQGDLQNTGASLFTSALAETNAFTSSLALPRLGELLTAPTLNTLNQNYWTMTRSSNNNNVYQITTETTAFDNTGSIPTQTSLLRPSVVIKRPVVIKQGDGTPVAPFELEVHRSVIEPLYTKNVEWLAGDHHTPLDLIRATDVDEDDLTSQVTYQSEPAFDPFTPGEYLITYNVADSYGTTALPLTIKVTVWNFSKIETGWYHSLALTSHGKVYAWGYNISGQIGDNTISSRSIPQRVRLNLEGKKIIDIAAGYYSSYAVSAAGDIYVWGNGGEGALGTGSSSNLRLPTQLTSFPLGVRFIQISSFGRSVVALTSTGQVYVWGDGAWGALGTGNNNDLDTPFLLSSLNSDLSEVIFISAGDYHGAAYTSDGRLCTWGNNYYGELALGYTTSLTTFFTPTCQPSFAPLKQIASGYDYSLGLTESGQAYAWGRGENYRLGTGSNSDVSTPVLLDVNGEEVAYLAAGYNHSVFVTTTGNVYGVGSNSYGKLGLSNTTSPQRDIIQSSFFGADDNRVGKVASAGYEASCVLTEQNLVHCYGYGGDGGLGNDSNSSHGTPQTWALSLPSLAEVTP